MLPWDWVRTPVWGRCRWWTRSCCWCWTGSPSRRCLGKMDFLLYTVCPRGLDPIYIVTYCIRWNKTSRADSMSKSGLRYSQGQIFLWGETKICYPRYRILLRNNQRTNKFSWFTWFTHTSLILPWVYQKPGQRKSFAEDTGKLRRIPETFAGDLGIF